MAPFLAVTLSLLILEPDMPRRKPTQPRDPAAKAQRQSDPVIDALQKALRQNPSAAGDTLLNLLGRFEAPGVDDLLKALQGGPGSAAQALLLTLNPNAAGLDIGVKEIYVCFPPGADLGPLPKDHPEGLPKNVRVFGTFTADLQAMSAALRQAGVTSVAMESTGIYWIPAYDLLEADGFSVLLADARQTADTPGRPKTDVKDCMWIQRLHSLGLLRASFRPQEPVRVWRSYQRHRASLVADCSRYIQRMHKALEQMNSSWPRWSPTSPG
jgi:hypothetical protein